MLQTDSEMVKQFAWNTFEIDVRKYKTNPFKKVIYLFLSLPLFCVCMYLYIYLLEQARALVRSGVLGNKIRTTKPFNLETLLFLTHQTWVLGSKHRSASRAVNALKVWAFTQASKMVSCEAVFHCIVEMILFSSAKDVLADQE